MFDAVFKGLSTLFRLRIVEKCFPGTGNAFGTVRTVFQNLRLGLNGEHAVRPTFVRHTDTDGTHTHTHTHTHLKNIRIIMHIIIV